MLRDRFSGLLALALGLATTASAREIVVTTTDNDSPSSDTELSLKEAIEQLQHGDTIVFRIPGPGPHYIKTPATGYALIDKNDVTIDGYTQQGSKPNTNSLGLPNTADLRIVLDSRDGGRRVIDYPGFGTSESAILPVLNGHHFTLRGVSVLSVPGADTDEDPKIYGVALIGESPSARIQGCWFGVDPAVKNFSPGANGRIPGIAGGGSAVASFRWSEGDVLQYSSGLLVGTDGDGVNDNAEFNVICGQLLAINLETPDARVSGNYVNFLPTAVPLAIDKIGLPDGVDVEFYENGNGDNNVIGTNGDGRNDTIEGNFIGPVRYDVYLEFWRPATQVVIAGNRIGVGTNGAVAFTTPDSTSLLVARKNSSIRVGTDANGISDAAEANLLGGFQGTLFKFHGSNNDEPDPAVRIAFRGNVSSGNFGTAPINPGQNVLPSRFYAGVLADAEGDIQPKFKAGTPKSISGSFPSPAAGAVPEGALVEVDFYLADAAGLTHTSQDYPAGWIQGARHLGTLREGSKDDLDAAANAFAFDISAWNLTLAALRQVVCVANYPLAGGIFSSSTFSLPLGDKASDATNNPPTAITISLEAAGAAGVKLTIAGGEAPFQVERKASLTDASWSKFTLTSDRTLNLPVTGGTSFIRVVGSGSVSPLGGDGR